MNLANIHQHREIFGIDLSLEKIQIHSKLEQDVSVPSFYQE